MTTQVFPIRGSFRGGTQVRFLSTDIDMTACQDDFSDGVVGALWTGISGGSGVVSEDGLNRELVLNSGTTAASFAGVRTAAQMADLDAEAEFRLITDTRPRFAAEAVFAELALKLASDSGVRLQLRQDRGFRFLRLEARLNGAVTADVARQIGKSADVGTRVTLRLLRAGPRVLAFRNGAVAFDLNWQADLAHVELGVRNDPDVSTQVVSRVARYNRRPVIVLGEEPIRDLATRRTTRAFGTTPAAACDEDAVDIRVTACTAAPAVVTDGFTYEREADLIRFRDRDKALVVCNDPILTKRRT